MEPLGDGALLEEHKINVTKNDAKRVESNGFQCIELHT